MPRRANAPHSPEGPELQHSRDLTGPGRNGLSLETLCMCVGPAQITAKQPVFAFSKDAFFWKTIFIARTRLPL